MAGLWKVTTIAGSIQGFANGPREEALFNSPKGIVVDVTGILYVVDFSNHKIRKILPDGTVSTLAGGEPGFADGPGVEARFNRPNGLAIDAAGVLYVTDSLNNRIRKILPDGTVSTLAGGDPDYVDGPGVNARFRVPSGITVDSTGILYITDTYNNRIRKILTDATVRTVAGGGAGHNPNGIGLTARFNRPEGLVVDATGVLYIADTNNGKIRRILSDGTVSTIVGRGRGFLDFMERERFINREERSRTFSIPTGIAIDTSGTLYVADNDNNRILKVLPNGDFRKIAVIEKPNCIAVDTSGDLYVTNASRIFKIEDASKPTPANRNRKQMMMEELKSLPGGIEYQMALERVAESGFFRSRKQTRKRRNSKSRYTRR